MSTNPNISLPSKLLIKTNREAEQIAEEKSIKHNLWMALDEFIHESRGEVEWPKIVFMPFSFWPIFLEEYFKIEDFNHELDNVYSRGLCVLYSSLASWRPTQDIVKFDPDIEQELRDMEFSGKIPSKILLRLPAWCIYVDAKLHMDGDDFEGFFAQLDYNEIGIYLALTFKTNGELQQRIQLALGDYTLEESMSKLPRKEGNPLDDPINSNDPGLIQAINMLTYICAYGLVDRQDYVGNTNRPTPKKTKKGWRIFPPDKPKTYTLGVEFGEKIRRERGPIGSKGGTVKPHIRRPHWHHYWTGSGLNKVLIVHWLPPIFVGNNEKDIEDK